MVTVLRPVQPSYYLIKVLFFPLFLQPDHIHCNENSLIFNSILHCCPSFGFNIVW